MSSTQQGYWRVSALQTLAANLTMTFPMIEPDGVAIVVEEDQAFLGQALAYVRDAQALLGRELPTIAVGVRLSGAQLEGLVHYAGLGSDVDKMGHVARCITEGRVGRNVLLLAPPFRACWLAALLRRTAMLRSLPCNVMGLSIPDVFTEDELLEHAAHITAQAQMVYEGAYNFGIEPVAGYEPGGSCHQALEHLLKA